MTWFADFLFFIITKVASYLFTKGLEWYHGEEMKKATDADIDARLKKFKESYKGAFNGEPITPEQRAELNNAINDFIRGDGGGV